MTQPEAARPPQSKLILWALYPLIYPVLIVGISGNWRWLEGWIFGGWFATFCIGTILYLYFKDPALLAERARMPGSSDQPKWDKVFTGAIFILFLAWFVLMPLDAVRFHWSPVFPMWLNVVGGLLLVPGAFFMFRALADNPFASGMVRIQEERKQRVVSSGVYGHVRHPMYLGAVCMLSGAPLLLGSTVGFVVSVLSVAILVSRILGEERLLVDQLDGYADYRAKVRHRLIPGIW